ncbi:alpha-ketoglutaric semialdehyde dehydrogenase GucD [Virgibacillus necropolis]|uniref:Aldehyde dehydrogenase family protein n=1 Tax=Virgibacillus necropolis TaxID=163877 RepID=A0A221MF48_9BACI|nr:alpha-ketoglutaric semialdehyde dehydrogenase GucD [Virgibacillus necropolis]ASN06265.1 aldehyde dehydrogenase family protein [Virgibacillus necropolis]
MSVTVNNKTSLNFLNGRWIPSVTGEIQESRNPANSNEIVGTVQRSSEVDLDNSVKAAKEALTAWKKLSGPERGQYLFKVANILEQRLDEIGECMTKEMGKTFPEAKGETKRAVDILRYFAGEGMRKKGDVIPSTDNQALMYTTRVPLGVVGVITPWNFPAAIPIWKIAPALIYGNTVVIKPATEAAVTMSKIIACFDEAGLPPGVINMVTGPGSKVGQAMIDHPDVNALTFTGSNQTGKKVAQGALDRGAKYQLEMGGKNPVIVLDDADLDLAVEQTINGGLRSTGQKCTATSRIIVQSGIYEQFKNKLLEKIKRIKIGDGMTNEVWMGPCASENQLNTVMSYIHKGSEEGATLIAGGKRLQDNEFADGYYVEPTVFENVTSDMTIAQEEIFGPVLALMKAETIKEALDLANDVKFGLSASIFTRNIANMLTFIDDMEAGLVRVNAESAGVELQAPFGGMKQSSSHSREQGQAAIEFFTSIKTVFVK